MTFSLICAAVCTISFAQQLGPNLSLQENPIKNLDVFLNLAIQMVRILRDLHQHHIIHKDIKPSNFIIHPETQTVKLTDFNFSSNL